MEVKISVGNIKLGKIFNVNLPPIITCAYRVPCMKKCYAMKAYRAYPNARNAWNDNLNLYTLNKDEYFASIINQLKKKKHFDRFRWHSSGDILD